MEKVTHVPWNAVLPQDIAYYNGYTIIDPPPLDEFGVTPVRIDVAFYKEILSEHDKTGESVQRIANRIRENYNVHSEC